MSRGSFDLKGGGIKMDALESATEITKAWIAHQPRMSSNILAKEIREIFLAAAMAYEEVIKEMNSKDGE